MHTPIKICIYGNKSISNAAFGTIRTMQDEKGEPLFCAKDVAEALGYKNTRDALHKHVEKMTSQNATPSIQ